MRTTIEKLNKLCKWRSLLAGWQLGTRADTDPECRAVRDHREATLLLRAELTALAGLLIEKGVFTREEYDAKLGAEAVLLDEAMAKRFPGIRTTDQGLEFYDLVKAGVTMEGWKP
jgi:hypothetical protein